MAGAPATYSELQEQVANYLDREDLTNEIQTFIADAEAMFNRMLLVPEREAVVTTTTTDSVLSLPSDFWGIRFIYLDTDPKTILEQMSIGELRAAHSAAATGQPQHFAMQSGNQLVLGPAPDSEYSAILNYWQTIPALSDDITSNWLLAAHYDLYRAGAMMEACAFTLDDAGYAKWSGIVSGKMLELTRSGQRKAASSSPQRIRSPYNV